MSEPHIITREEMMKSKGIGASDVAAIMSLSPWQTALELFEIKTGRRPKPPQTEAMKRGNELEPIAFKEYCELTGFAGEQQIVAIHPDLPYLRCIADGWDGKRLLEIKSPQSKKLIESVRQGIVPDHYALQCATSMYIFGVGECDFYVFDAEGSELTTVDWSRPFMGTTLFDYWGTMALPAIERFWGCFVNDTWAESGTPEINVARWLVAIETRRKAVDQISKLEIEKDRADSELKQMISGAKSATAAGWQAGWQDRKGSFGVGIKVDSAETMQEILTALESIRGMAGVKAVEAAIRQPSRSFTVKKEK
jgi:putative phage-type endonuclease